MCTFFVSANGDTLHTVTNYECYKGLYSSHNDKNYFEIAYSLNRQFGDYGIYKELPLYNFVDNHDVNRIASTLRDSRHLVPLHTLLYTIPGVPSIYYGSEWAIQGVKSNGSDAALRPCLQLEEMMSNKGNVELLKFIAKLGEVRLNSKALQRGQYKQVLVANKHFVFMRQCEEECFVICVNLDEVDVVVEANIQAAGGVGNGKLIDLLQDQFNCNIENGRAQINIPACGARIMKVM